MKQWYTKKIKQNPRVFALWTDNFNNVILLIDNSNDVILKDWLENFSVIEIKTDFSMKTQMSKPLISGCQVDDVRREDAVRERY